MLDASKFKEKDLENLTKLLNFIAEKGKFKLTVKDTITFYGLMAWAQQELRKKVQDNIFEYAKVHEAPEGQDTPEEAGE